MSARTLTVTCFACGSGTMARLPDRQLGGSVVEGSNLKGTSITCDHCGRAFDCYYY